MKRKSWIAIMLSMVMAVTLLPSMAFADEVEGVEETDAVVETELVDEEEPEAVEEEELSDEVAAQEVIEEDVVQAAGVSLTQEDYTDLFVNILENCFRYQSFFNYYDEDEYVCEVTDEECGSIPVEEAFKKLQVSVTYNGRSYTAINRDLQIDPDLTMFEFVFKGFPFESVQPGESCKVTLKMDGYSKSEVIKKMVLEAKMSEKYVWTGSVIKPSVTLTCNGTELVQGEDYFMKYALAGKSVGTHYVGIALSDTYMDNCTNLWEHNQFDDEDVQSNTVWFWYDIIPKGTSVSKLKKGNKAITVNWKKQSAKMSKSTITGYQIQVATDSKFTQNKKTVKVKGYKNTSKTIKKLKKNKKYYVRVRTYKVADGDNYYSKWSAAKTVKTR